MLPSNRESRPSSVSSVLGSGTIAPGVDWAVLSACRELRSRSSPRRLSSKLVDEGSLSSGSASDSASSQFRSRLLR
jgi:hypothetical protein